MAEEIKKQDQLLETTDCLEAIGTLKSSKNLFFFIIFLCLLILQTIFWLIPTRYVVRPGQESQKDVAPIAAMIMKLSSVVNANEPEMKIETKGDKIEQAATALLADANSAADPNAVKANNLPQIKIPFAHLAWTIRFCNYVLAVSAVIYSLTLLFGMKVSLVGRLGGISHITKAVFMSFIMVVLILPWQLLFKGVIAGVIYTPAELLAAWESFDNASVVENSLMFLRFSGLWLVVVLILLWAQIKSMRWSKNTLKRLGIAG
ncbi:MAG: hypothetical protein WC770_05185 [Phycisphaerae bacterium]|jgi:hypothetical protein